MAKGVEDIGSIAHQAAGFGIGARRINGWKPVTRRQHGKLNAPRVENEPGATNEASAFSCAILGERLVDFPGVATSRNETCCPRGGRLCFAQCRLIVLRRRSD